LDQAFFRRISPTKASNQLTFAECKVSHNL